ncbi:MAG: hypothetical protein RBR53_03055 [Desulforegulaceae bacterium]|nr:hypothetical protein [Desulforegulaceae bacterium]
MLLHFGKSGQPQNFVPVFCPFLASLKIIGLPHFGQMCVLLFCFSAIILLTCLTCSRCVLKEGESLPCSIAAITDFNSSFVKTISYPGINVRS